MAKNIDRVAELLSVKQAGRVPKAGGGAFGVARLARLLHERLTPGQGRRPGRPRAPRGQSTRRS